MKLKVTQLTADQDWESFWNQGPAQLIIDHDEWIRFWKEGAGKHKYDFFKVDGFLLTLLELIRLADLAEGEPDPARDAIIDFKKAFERLMEFAKVPVLPSIGAIPTVEAKVENFDDIPF